MKSFPPNMTADGLFSTSFISLNRGDLDCNSLELAVFHSLHNLIPLSRPGVLCNCHMDLTLRYLRCEQADLSEMFWPVSVVLCQVVLSNLGLTLQPRAGPVLHLALQVTEGQRLRAQFVVAGVGTGNPMKHQNV